MGWMIGIATYAVLLMAVVLIAGGRRRGDLRHAAAVNELAAFETVGPAQRQAPPFGAAAGGEQRI